jgi:hypothetical protein
MGRLEWAHRAGAHLEERAEPLVLWHAHEAVEHASVAHGELGLAAARLRH